MKAPPDSGLEFESNHALYLINDILEDDSTVLHLEETLGYRSFG
jgi:hypothetical protein